MSAEQIIAHTIETAIRSLQNLMRLILSRALLIVRQQLESREKIDKPEERRD